MGNWDYDPTFGKSKGTEEKVEDTFEDTSDLFSMDDSDVEEESESEAPEKEPEETPKPVIKEPARAQGATGVNAEALKEELLKQVGGETVIKIKGKEMKIADLTPDELVNGLQKAFRADQLFNEVSASRRQLEEEKRRLEERSALLERSAAMAADRQAPTRGQEGTVADTLPEALRPNEYDSPEVRTLKMTIAGMQERFNRLETGFAQRGKDEQINSIRSEIESLGKDYPMAAKDEVFAIKLSHPEVNSEELMRAAHEYYSSSDHIQAAFKHNPTFKREYDESVIKSYLAKQQSAKKIAGQPRAAGSSSEGITSKAKKPTRDFRSAEEASKAYIEEMMRSS